MSQLNLDKLNVLGPPEPTGGVRPLGAEPGVFDEHLARAGGSGSPSPAEEPAEEPNVPDEPSRPEPEEEAAAPADSPNAEDAPRESTDPPAQTDENTAGDEPDQDSAPRPDSGEPRGDHLPHAAVVDEAPSAEPGPDRVASHQTAPADPIQAGVDPDQKAVKVALAQPAAGDPTGEPVPPTVEAESHARDPSQPNPDPSAVASEVSATENAEGPTETGPFQPDGNSTEDPAPHGQPSAARGPRAIGPEASSRPPSSADAQPAAAADGSPGQGPLEAGLVQGIEGRAERQADAGRDAVPSGEADPVQPVGSEASAATGESPGPIAGPETNSQASTEPPRTASPAGAPDAPEADGVDRVRFVQRMARAFEAAGRGGSIQLRLHPPELGSLHLELTVQNGVMTARLEAESAAARNLLLDNLPALRDRLAEQDIRVERFDVELGTRTAGGSPQGPDDQHQPFEQPDGTNQPADATPQDGETDAAAEPPTGRPAGGGRFDVTI